MIESKTREIAEEIFVDENMQLNTARKSSKFS